MAASASFKSAVFPIEIIDFGDTQEAIVRGGRDKFSLAVQALRDQGIHKVGVIGFGSQAPAQAKNLRDSLAGTGIKVVVGLRDGSKSLIKARKAGFNEEDGTLGEMYQVIADSDLVILLISDAAQVENYKKIFIMMKKGAILGLSHGFLQGYLDSIGESFPDHFSVIGVCPKGMGPSVRRLYEQGSGVNCSFATSKGINSGGEVDVALAWAVLIGAPTIFRTTLRKEYKSDLVGERFVLLGAVYAIVKVLYDHFITLGMSQEDAFNASAENITGPLSRLISREGIIGVYNSLDEKGREIFAEIYSAAYNPFMELLREIYDEVGSGIEIKSVVMAGERLKRFPMSQIGGTLMWRVGEKVRAKRTDDFPAINPFTAGLYCAAMMAQIDLFTEKEHNASEIANESIIEAVDSLNPFMHFAGLAYMVDNCSTTARLGARKWGPRCMACIEEQIFPVFCKENFKGNDTLMDNFLKHPIHKVFTACAAMRPPVDIQVS